MQIDPLKYIEVHSRKTNNGFHNLKYAETINRIKNSRDLYQEPSQESDEDQAGDCESKDFKEQTKFLFQNSSSKQKQKQMYKQRKYVLENRLNTKQQIDFGPSYVDKVLYRFKLREQTGEDTPLSFVEQAQNYE